MVSAYNDAIKMADYNNARQDIEIRNRLDVPERLQKTIPPPGLDPELTLNTAFDIERELLRRGIPLEEALEEGVQLPRGISSFEDLRLDDSGGLSIQGRTVDDSVGKIYTQEELDDLTVINRAEGTQPRLPELEKIANDFGLPFNKERPFATVDEILEEQAFRLGEPLPHTYTQMELNDMFAFGNTDRLKRLARRVGVSANDLDEITINDILEAQKRVLGRKGVPTAKRTYSLDELEDLSTG